MPVRATLIASCMMLAACSAPLPDRSADEVSRTEAEALNDAAQMLDDNAVVPLPVDNTSTR